MSEISLSVAGAKEMSALARGVGADSTVHNGEGLGHDVGAAACQVFAVEERLPIVGCAGGKNGEKGGE